MEKFELADRIAYYRQRDGISKKELAEMCGVSPSMITKYEDGTAMPSADTIAAISNVLGVTMNRLVCGFDEK